MQDVGIGVIGLGRLGHMHAYNIAYRTPQARLVAVCDVVEDLASATAAELGCKCYTDFRKMLDDPAIDAVCVVTPTGLHVDPVKAAVEAKKPLFCEKPLAGTWEDTLLLVPLIQKAGIKCQIGFNRRFDPHFVEAGQRIADGVIGRPVYFYSLTRDPFPPPPWASDPSKGGGLFVDSLLHDFDMARHLMRDEAVRAYGDETNMVVDPQGIHRFADNVTVNLHFRGGALANFHASNHAGYAHDVRTEVYGEKGCVIIGGLNRAEVTVCTHDGGIQKPVTFLPIGNMPPFAVRFRESYELEMAAFAECVRDDKPPAVNETDALEAYRISLTAMRSAGERQPIDL
jgi:scyllo-inositol 2-dehydrogenase (NAD+)